MLSKQGGTKLPNRDDPHHKTTSAIHLDDHKYTLKRKQLVQDVAKLLLMGETHALLRTQNAIDVGKQDILKANVGVP